LFFGRQLAGRLFGQPSRGRFDAFVNDFENIRVLFDVAVQLVVVLDVVLFEVFLEARAKINSLVYAVFPKDGRPTHRSFFTS
jgi:hypothetical protein